METKRCTEKDATGLGCVKASGHGGRCKVRPDPDRVFAAGPDPAQPASAHVGIGAHLMTLAASVAEVEAEVNRLMADLHAAMARMADKVADANTRATSTLKPLVKSRRQVQAMLAAQGDAPEGGAIAGADGE